MEIDHININYSIDKASVSSNLEDLAKDEETNDK